MCNLHRGWFKTSYWWIIGSNALDSFTDLEQQCFWLPGLYHPKSQLFDSIQLADWLVGPKQTKTKILGLIQCLNWLYNRFCGGYVGFCMEYRSCIKSSFLWIYGLNELYGQLVLKQPLFWLNGNNLSQWWFFGNYVLSCCAEVDHFFVWLPEFNQFKNQLNGPLQVSVWQKQFISWLIDNSQTCRSYWQLNVFLVWFRFVWYQQCNENRFLSLKDTCGFMFPRQQASWLIDPSKMVNVVLGSFTRISVCIGDKRLFYFSVVCLSIGHSFCFSFFSVGLNILFWYQLLVWDLGEMVLNVLTDHPLYLLQFWRISFCSSVPQVIQSLNKPFRWTVGVFDVHRGCFTSIFWWICGLNVLNSYSELLQHLLWLSGLNHLKNQPFGLIQMSGWLIGLIRSNSIFWGIISCLFGLSIRSVMYRSWFKSRLMWIYELNGLNGKLHLKQLLVWLNENIKTCRLFWQMVFIMVWQLNDILFGHPLYLHQFWNFIVCLSGLQGDQSFIKPLGWNSDVCSMHRGWFKPIYWRIFGFSDLNSCIVLEQQCLLLSGWLIGSFQIKFQLMGLNQLLVWLSNKICDWLDDYGEFLL